MSTISRRSFVQSVGAATLAPGMLLVSAETGAASESSASPQGASANYADYKHIQVTKDHGVATVTLNYAPLNLLDEVLSDEFDRVTRQLEQDASVRVIILQSAVPKFFIAHSGLHRVGSAPKTTSNTRTFRLTQMLGERLRNMPKAVIAKVEGIARGGGCEIALAADMCFAAIGKAVFGQPEVVCGLVPGGATHSACRGAWGAHVPLRCCSSAETSRQNWPTTTVISIERCRQENWGNSWTSSPAALQPSPPPRLPI